MGILPDADAIEQEMARLTAQAGGGEQLADELAKHGVTVEDARSLFEKGFLASIYADQIILPRLQADAPGEAVRAWLDAERTRRGVKILQYLD